MSFLLLMIAFVLSGGVGLSNKALVEWNLGAYRELYLLAVYATAMILGASAMLVRQEESSAADRRIGSLMGLSLALTMLCFLVALQHMPGIVAFPVRNLGNLVLTAVVSIAAWKERLSRSQWSGIVLAIAAIWLIY